MKNILISYVLLLTFLNCQNNEIDQKEIELKYLKAHLTDIELLERNSHPFLQMSAFSKPSNAGYAEHTFTGNIVISRTELDITKRKTIYPGENIFPDLQIGFISSNNELIPIKKDKILTTNESYWDIIVGTGKIWQSGNNSDWSRASFPFTLTDRWIGSARNCVGIFLFNDSSISNICIQCSQETADKNDGGIFNIKGVLKAHYTQIRFEKTNEIIKTHFDEKNNRIVTVPLDNIDVDNKIAMHLHKPNMSIAPMSLGAILVDSILYLDPPKTRHGSYPYPNEMRHGLFSVTKSMVGALALLYFEERYDDNVFNQLISDHVIELENHPGWKGATFYDTLNMVTGVDGGEDSLRLFNTLIIAESSEEAIDNISQLKDLPEKPGTKFNYASTNLFVLSYALQKYVEKKEGNSDSYWKLIQENVLIPIGAKHFSVLKKKQGETNNKYIPILAYGALPTIDEASKITLLFLNQGNFKGNQLLNKNRINEIFKHSPKLDHQTNNDLRGDAYKHTFWKRNIQFNGTNIPITYMLGYGENYVIFLPNKSTIFRLYDEHDLNVDDLVKSVLSLKSF